MSRSWRELSASRTNRVPRSRPRALTIVATLVVLFTAFPMTAPPAQAAQTTRAGAPSSADVGANAWTPRISPLYTDQEERRFDHVDTGQRNLLIDICPSGRFCVAAGEGNGLHTVFYLYRCTERSLANFIGDGSAKNVQTDNATARLLNQNRVVRVTLSPDPDPVRIDWDEIYYIDPC